MRTYSLRSRLTRWITLPTLLAAVLTLVAGFLFAWHEIEEVYDAEMVHTAKLLQQITHYEMGVHEDFRDIELGQENSDLKHRYEKYITYRIWHDGHLLTRAWKTAEFGDLDAPKGFSDQEIAGHQWRVFVYINEEDRMKIEVAQRYSIRLELSGQLMSSLVMPGLIFVPVIILILLVGIRRALTPLVRVSTEVDQRNSDDLAPLRNMDIPEEISPLILALNRLFGRLAASFQREREFTDHAAHELRTPLAAMKTQTQVLLRESMDYPELAPGLKNLHASINRANHLVEQLLYLSRLQNKPLPLTPMNLSQTLEDAVAGVMDRAAKKNQSLEVDIVQGITVEGHNDALDIVLTNLLENAVKYTPDQGRIDVRLDSRGRLTISDNGPGLSDEEKSRVFNRFFRADKSGQSGSGLGLSIADWIAREHGLTIELQDNPGGGLRVVMQWPQPVARVRPD